MLPPCAWPDERLARKPPRVSPRRARARLADAEWGSRRGPRGAVAWHALSRALAAIHTRDVKPWAANGCGGVGVRASRQRRVAWRSPWGGRRERASRSGNRRRRAGRPCRRRRGPCTGAEFSRPVWDQLRARFSLGVGTRHPLARAKRSGDQGEEGWALPPVRGPRSPLPPPERP